MITFSNVYWGLKYLERGKRLDIVMLLPIFIQVFLTGMFYYWA